MPRTSRMSATDLGPAPEAERRARMTRYLVSMAIRIACLIAILLLTDPILIAICATGAIFIPWFAVIAANAPRATPPNKRVPVTRELPAPQPPNQHT